VVSETEKGIAGDVADTLGRCRVLLVVLEASRGIRHLRGLDELPQWDVRSGFPRDLTR